MKTAIEAPLPQVEKDRNLKSILLGSLSRVTSPGRKFVPQIDGLRCVAIMSVVAYHVRFFCISHRGLALTNLPDSWLSTIFSAGHNGVPLFFAISGFILSLPFARQGLCGGPKVNIREYYYRRVTRIEPPYVIQLALMFLLCAFVLRRLPTHPHLYHNPNWYQYALTHILASLVYLHSLLFGDHPYPNVVLWSLEVEVQFYLLAPFLARTLFIRNRVRRRCVLAVLFCLGLTISLLFGSHYRVWTSLLGNLGFFIIGFFFADLYAEGELLRTPGSLMWDVALLAAGGLVVLNDNTGPIGGVLLPLAVFVCFLAAFRGLITAWFLSNIWTATVGGMCYTIYMYHMLAISTLIRVTERVRVSNFTMDLLIQFVLLSVGIIPICAILFALLERPFMDRSWPAKARRMVTHLFSSRQRAAVPLE